MRIALVMAFGLFLTIVGFARMQKERELADITTVTPKGYAPATAIKKTTWEDNLVAKAQAADETAGMVSEPAVKKTKGKKKLARGRTVRHALAKR